MRPNDAFALRFGQNAAAIDAAAVVRDADRDAGALAHRREDDLAFRVFLGALALGRRLDAMVHGVPQQVHERIAQLVEDLPVELDLFAFDAERHLLPQLPRDVAHQPWKTVEHLPHRRHARLNDLVLEIGGEARDLNRDLVDRRILADPARGQLVQAATLGHQLADQVHERVEPAQIDADMPAAPSRRPSPPPPPPPPHPPPPPPPPPHPPPPHPPPPHPPPPHPHPLPLTGEREQALPRAGERG